MKWRVIAGATLIAAVCLLSVGKQLADALALGPHFRYGDVVADYDQRRFETLKPALPPHGVVGYVEDDPQQPDAIALYHLTQFVLAPVVVDRGTNHRAIVGNDRNATEPPSRLEMGLRPKHDAGDGVRLYDNEAPLIEAGQ